MKKLGKNLIKYADKLDRKGNTEAANFIDNLLVKLSEEKSVEQQKESQVKEIFLKLEKLNKIYKQYLNNCFGYFGEENIDIIFNSFDTFLRIFKDTLKGKDLKFNVENVKKYDEKLEKIRKEIERSSKMKLTPMKVKVDKFLLYDELENLLEAFERNASSEYGSIIAKGRNLLNAFANIIKTTTEEISNLDIIEES